MVIDVSDEFKELMRTEESLASVSVERARGVGVRRPFLPEAVNRLDQLKRARGLLDRHRQRRVRRDHGRGAVAAYSETSAAFMYSSGVPSTIVSLSRCLAPVITEQPLPIIRL